MADAAAGAAAAGVAAEREWVAPFAVDVRRTLSVQGRRVLGNVGGGVTLRSQPRAEYDETLAKARGMLRALGAVE